MVVAAGDQATRHLGVEQHRRRRAELAAGGRGSRPRDARAGHRPRAAALAQGEKDPREGQSPATGQGGRDTYGYVWIDSNEPGGPIYDWVDISGVGQTVGNADDASYGPFDLGFAFPYYGDTFAQVRICTNGFITFDGSSSSPYTNQPMPSTDAPNLMVAPFWDDLNPDSGGAIYRYHDVANDRYIVQWDGVPHYPADGSFTFQAILYASGVIVFQYHDFSYGNQCTVGIENHDASDGLQVVYNGTYLTSGMAIRLSAGSQVPWLDFDPLAGVVASGESVDIAFTFDTTGLALGDYEAVVTFSSNDADRPRW